MSDQAPNSQVTAEEPTTECSVCGHVPGPYPECQLCLGNRNFTQPRAFTLSEERRGVGSNDPDRYSRTGNVAPKVLKVPGSWDPSQGDQ